VLRKLFLLGLLAGALTAGCSRHSPTAPDPQPSPPAGMVPPPPAPPPPPSPAPTPPAKISRTRFLAFGDSMTAGTTSAALTSKLNAGLPQSYPFKLQSLLKQRYSAQMTVVHNEGLPGEEASDAVRRLPRVLHETSPEVVILLHGVNDLTSPAVVLRTVSFLNTMAREARFFGADVFLCTLPPQRPGGFRAVDPTALANYNAGLREVARGEGAVLVDLSREMDLSLIGVDGLHPTEAGYDRMAEIILALLRARFERGVESLVVQIAMKMSS